MTTNDDIMKGLDRLRLQADENNKDLKKEVMRRIDELENKVDKAKKEAKENDKKVIDKVNEILTRLEKLESSKEVDQTKNMRMREEEQKKRTNKLKNQVGLTVEKNTPEKQVKTWSKIVEETRAENQEKNLQDRQKKIKQWKKTVQIKEKRKYTDVIDDTNEKDNKKEKDAEEIIEEKLIKIGDNKKEHGEDDWSWDECLEDWDGTEEKIEIEKRKKIQRYRRRKMMQADTAKKGKHMVGLSPIRRQSIGFFNNITTDFEEAKRMAVNKFLVEYLQITEEEMLDFEIIDSLLAKNENDLMYVTFKEHSSIKDIHRRAAEIRNDDIKVRNYIPPQFWDRYFHLSRHCTKMRDEDKDIKNYIRFNDNDLEVLVKNRRIDDHYSILPLTVIEEQGPIPKFNHNLVWKKRNDRTPRSALREVTTKVCPPSIRAETSPQSSEQPSKRKRVGMKNSEEQGMDIADSSSSKEESI